MSGQLTSTLATGTAPFVIASTTKVSNLNADLLDGADWTAPGTIGSVTPSSGAFTTVSATGQITSTLATGTAPLVVSSTTQVSNLNVSQLVGSTWAIPAAIGSTTPAAGTFTTLAGNTSLTIGSGTAITKVQVITASITPASVNAQTVAEQTFTFTGVTTSDIVFINPPSIGNSTGICGVRVTALNTVGIRFNNPTAGALTPTAGSYTIVAIRS